MIKLTGYGCNKIRAELQEIATKNKGSGEKSLHSLVNDALGSLKDYLGSNQDVLSLTEEPLSVINCLNGEQWIGSDGKAELTPHKPESQLLHCLPYEYDPKATCTVFDRLCKKSLRKRTNRQKCVAMYKSCSDNGYHSVVGWNLKGEFLVAAYDAHYKNGG